MELVLERKWKKKDYTIGRLYVDGKLWCNTLEDIVREIDENGVGKIKGKTAIPAGRYRVIYNYSPKFGRNMPRLLHVPWFEGILIHPGNSTLETEGCILVGYNTEVGRLTQSRDTSDRLNVMIEDEQRHGRDIWIEIK